VRNYKWGDKVNIYLYNNNSEINVVNKNITNETSLTGYLRDNSDIRNPVIRINSDESITTFNYCYIPSFNRYYFITDINVIRTGIWSMSLKCDVLMSFKDDILNSYAIINHTTENQISRYMQSDIYKTLVKDFTDIITFPSGLLETGEYILITAGGNS